jgi:hypothetical protein
MMSTKHTQGKEKEKKRDGAVTHAIVCSRTVKKGEL